MTKKKKIVLIVTATVLAVGITLILIQKQYFPAYFMKPSQKLIDYLRLKEGFSAKPYLDPPTQTKLYSVGYGHQIQPDEGYLMNGVDRATADQLLFIDVTAKSGYVQKFVHVPLTQGMFDALTDFCYNMGQGAFQRSTLLKKINEGAGESEIRFQFARWENKERRQWDADVYFS